MNWANTHAFFARVFWCNNRETEDRKYWVLSLFPPLLQTHDLSQLSKMVFTLCVNLAVFWQLPRKKKTQNKVIKRTENHLGGGIYISSYSKGVRNPSISSALQRNNSKHLSGQEFSQSQYRCLSHKARLSAFQVIVYGTVSSKANTMSMPILASVSQNFTAFLPCDLILQQTPVLGY